MHMHRLHDGQPIRNAMREAGLSIPKLAAKTREIDEEGKGLSPALIGFAVSTGSSAREEISDRAAQLMADALGTPVHDLFGSD